ncbi:hypothetical protein [Actinophytocola sp.]|uniref:hypothetical protein n=1 Tax=Actinophytocola sp. TaxID=1872138 RepID=UPI002D586F05|nr:hypothetical protein [Actinophytocola sp.]HYQ67672.1 hypothetical protein [Actinophytocola sp.]
MGQIFNMTPHQIYEYFATAPGTERLDNAQNATRQEWVLDEDRAALIRKQRELIRGSFPTEHQDYSTSA